MLETTNPQYAIKLGTIMALAAVIVVGLVLMWYAPCVTGEVSTTTAVSQEGKLLVSTAPVCPEEGQLMVRALLVALVVGGLIILAVKVVMDADARGDAAVAIAGMTMGYAPRSTIDLQARHAASGQDAYLTVAQVEAMLAKAALDNARADDLRGQSEWTATRPVLPQATTPPPTAPQNGHGSNGANGHRTFSKEEWS